MRFMLSRPAKLRTFMVCAALVALRSGTASAADEAERSDAEQAPEDEARRLFSEARKLAKAGDFEKACPKFEASLKLKAGMGTQFNLADCWQQLGRTASARELFLKVAEAAHDAKQEEREVAARERAKALEAKVPRLAIGVKSPVSGLIVERGDERVDNEHWSLAVPIDPGTYEITARAKGYKSWSKTVKLPARDETLALEVPELSEIETKAPAVPSDRKVAAKPKPKPAPAVEINPQTQSWFTTGRKAGLVLAGVGAAGLTVGVLASLKYKSQDDEARTICPTSVDCTHAEIIDHGELVQGSKTARYWAFIGYGVGGAAVIGSTVAFIAGATPPPGARAKLSAQPWIAGDGSFGAAISGRW